MARKTTSISRHTIKRTKQPVSMKKKKKKSQPGKLKTSASRKIHSEMAHYPISKPDHPIQALNPRAGGDQIGQTLEEETKIKQPSKERNPREETGGRVENGRVFILGEGEWRGGIEGLNEEITEVPK